nr:MAG TPA: hypothetical protein [Caudoviricetes sp.]
MLHYAFFTTFNFKQHISYLSTNAQKRTFYRLKALIEVE